MDSDPQAHPSDLIDVTTAAYLCDIGASCPCMLLSIEDDSYYVVGSTIDHPQVPAMRTRVASDETATKLPRRLVEEAVINSILTKQSTLIIVMIIMQCMLVLTIRPVSGAVRSLYSAMVASARAVSRLPAYRTATPAE